MLIQAIIVVCSCISIGLLSSKKHFRYGFIAGVVGQPFWIYETLRTEQWGMFIVSLWFIWSHARGIKNNFKWRI